MNPSSDVNVHFENKRISRAFFVFLWFMYSTVYMTKNCFSGALAAIVDEGIFTLSETTLISSVFYAVYAPLQVLGGILADKINSEKLITVGLLGGAACNIVIFLNQSYPVMLLSWAFNAAVQLGIWPAVFKIMSSQLVRSDRRTMVFYMSFATSGGLLLSYLVSAFLTDWRYNFLISATVLIADAVLLLFIYGRVKHLLIKDKPRAEKNSEKGSAASQSTARIFAAGGLFVLIPAVVFKTMVENGSKTLSPTMLLQSYESISPMLGNLLNIFIIVSGVLGILFVKFLFYPRIIKNEMLAIFILFASALPFVILLQFVGKIPIWLAVLALSMISMLLSGTALLVNYYNMNYIFCAKNGSAAGIINSAASAGLLLQYLVFGSLAERLGWNTVIIAWSLMLGAALVCVAFVIKPTAKLKSFNS